MTQKAERKAVIYARIANNSPIPAEVRGFTIAGQEQSCLAYAKERGYAVAAMFEDIGSGNGVVRPGFQSMLEFLHKHGPEHYAVLIADRSRLARNGKAYLELREKIVRMGGYLDGPMFQREQERDSEI